MAEFEIDGVRYRSGKLNAFEQDRIVRRLGPVLASSQGALGTLLDFADKLRGDGRATEGDKPKLDFKAIQAFGDLLRQVRDEDAEAIFAACLKVTYRLLENGAAEHIYDPREGKPLPEIDAITMYGIVGHVIRDNLANFTTALGSLFRGATRA